VPTEQELLNAIDAVRGMQLTAYDDAVDDGPLVPELLNPGQITHEEAVDELSVTI